VTANIRQKLVNKKMFNISMKWAVVLSAFVTICNIEFASASGGVAFKYPEDASWGNTCKNGKRQSPINIQTSATIKSCPGQISEVDSYSKSPTWCQIVKDKTSVEVKCDYMPMMKGCPNGKTQFRVLSFHFHFGGSEHLINGRRTELEMHVVHYIDKTDASHSAKSVVGVMIEGGGTHNPAFQGIVNRLRSGGPVAKTEIPILSKLLPGDWKNRYYTYQGSLTTPPCTENVQWIVAKTRVRISNDQMKAFAVLGHTMRANFRQKYSSNIRVQEC